MADVNIADLTRAVDKFTPTGDTAADRLALETYEVQLSALDDGITAAAMAPATAPPHAHDAARTSRLARLLKLSTGGCRSGADSGGYPSRKTDTCDGVTRRLVSCALSSLKGLHIRG